MKARGALAIRGAGTWADALQVDALPRRVRNKAPKLTGEHGTTDLAFAQLDISENPRSSTLWLSTRELPCPLQSDIAPAPAVIVGVMGDGADVVEATQLQDILPLPQPVFAVATQGDEHRLHDQGIFERGL